MTEEIVNPSETINELDKAKRIADDEEILKKAQRLSNGCAGNDTLLGEVVFWQVKKAIAHSTLLREVIDAQALFALKSECVEAHTPRKINVRLWGQLYAVPAGLGIGIISFFIFMYCRKNGLL